MNPVYKASDGSEHPSAKAAAHQEKIIQAVMDARVVLRTLSQLVGESALTADGEQIDMTRSRTYWAVHDHYGVPPRLHEIHLYPYNLTVDMDRGDCQIVLREYRHDGRNSGYTTYKISELYAHQDKARERMMQLCEQRLAEMAEDIRKIKAECKGGE